MLVLNPRTGLVARSHAPFLLCRLFFVISRARYLPPPDDQLSNMPGTCCTAAITCRIQPPLCVVGCTLCVKEQSLGRPFCIRIDTRLEKVSRQPRQGREKKGHLLTNWEY